MYKQLTTSIDISLNETRSAYKQILKATSIFGGLQVFNIIISIIRSKFIAVYLGPVGMGVFGLLSSTLGLIGGLTNFGITNSAVKDIAIANENGDKINTGKVIKTLNILAIITGLLGVIITIIFSQSLSMITFGTTEYTTSFILISVSLFLSQVSNSQLTILQGLRRIKDLALSNALGSLIGLIISIPMYYYYGIKAITSVIILTSFSSYLVSIYFVKKLNFSKTKIDKIALLDNSKKMLVMGFMISISGFLTIGTSYLIRIYISNNGSIEDVGLYAAGFAILNTYVGIIFSAMGADYFPRLSEVSHDNNLTKVAINQQSEIAILILSPIIIIFLLFIKWAVIILYSEKFAPIENLLTWASVGMFFKALSWAIAFIFLAKGSTRLFFWNELITNIYVLLINLMCYDQWGITGLGISFLIGYLVYFIQVYYIAKRLFSFSFSIEVTRIILIQLGLIIACFVIISTSKPLIIYTIGALILMISLFITYKEINDKVDLIPTLARLKNKLTQK